MKPITLYNEPTVDRIPLLVRAHAKLEFIFFKIPSNTKHAVPLVHFLNSD